MTDLADGIAGVIKHAAGHLELLGGPQVSEASVPLSQPPNHGARIAPAGVELRVGSKETLLQAALNQGIAFPHDCRAGGCGACRCSQVTPPIAPGRGGAQESGIYFDKFLDQSHLSPAQKVA